MNRMITALCLCLLIFTTRAVAGEGQRGLEIKGKRLVSQSPPFTLTLPSELELVSSFSHENPGENSITRIYFLGKTKGKQVEEMLILQIADRTGPPGISITMPPLKPYTEKRMFVKDRIKKGGVTLDYLIQLMGWNPVAPSLQPMIKKGMIIPNHWALQGQFQFVFHGAHAVSLRYSKDLDSFGTKVSDAGGAWETGSISGDEKRVYETFRKTFLEMINTFRTATP